MSTPKHTQGPWTAGRADMSTIVDGIESKWIYAGEQYVAVASGRIDGEWDEVMANARLIAAAPDLLAALKLAATGIWRDKEMNACGIAGGSAVVHAIEAAIARAETAEGKGAV